MPTVGIVAIGRNEGERFKACIASMPDGIPVVYVDSGSTDGSVAFARSNGVDVVELPSVPGFTAARARNAGWRRLVELHPGLAFVQFVDGDCALAPGWTEGACADIQADDRIAVVFGRRRERFPEASIYNAQCDREWNVPVGEVRACGGDALMRVAALRAAGGYTDDLIAGEEPDLCLRVRALGWRILRIDREMTVHDARILHLSTWWKRAKRGGHAYAEHVWRHRRDADPDWTRSVVSALFWGALLPGLALIGLGLALLWDVRFSVVPIAIGLLIAIQYARMARRSARAGEQSSYAFREAALLILVKYAELAGAMKFLFNRVFQRRSSIIEYK
jgi:glycosyltransferase involved in cell wall biosynthesis